MADSRRLPIALIQMQVSEDPDANLGKAVELVDAAARDGARLICLPELFRSRYFCQAEDPARFGLAEPIPGPSTEALSKVASARR
jgi:N-carbamoylputrescine amidase